MRPKIIVSGSGLLIFYKSLRIFNFTVVQIVNNLVNLQFSRKNHCFHFKNSSDNFKYLAFMFCFKIFCEF